jgi:hypothetical protein
MFLLWWCPFKIWKEKLASLQFTSMDYLSIVLTPVRIRWTVPLKSAQHQPSAKKPVKIWSGSPQAPYQAYNLQLSYSVLQVYFFFLWDKQCPPSPHPPHSCVAGLALLLRKQPDPQCKRGVASKEYWDFLIKNVKCRLHRMQSKNWFWGNLTCS